MSGGSADRDRRLVEAFTSLALGLELPDLLKRIITAACGIAGATRGSLAATGAEQLLVEFTSDRLDDQGVASLGPLPADFVAPAGALTAPIRVGYEVFGELSLCDKRDGAGFNSTDEQLISGLATAAGAAIANSRLHEEAQRRQQALGALQSVATALLAGSAEGDVLALIANHARNILDADAATVVLRTDRDDVLEVAAGVGGQLADAVGDSVPARRSISGQVMVSGLPMNLTDTAAAGRGYRPLLDALGGGPALFVPLWLHGEPFGTLAVGRSAGAAWFTDIDLTLAQSFATQASVALEYSSAQEQLRVLAVYEDQERIARDLHDSVIQHLFAVCMSLQAGSRSSKDPALTERIERAIDDIDATIGRIRSTIFALGDGVGAGGLRAAVGSVLGELAPVYGLQPTLEVVGAVDAATRPGLAEHVTSVVREAVSNVGRHADASRVDVELVVDATEFVLRVRDNGRGIGTQNGRRSGLANMESRALELGGSMTVSAGEREGTLIEWRVPVAAR
ncbi:MAG TPA: GAF domain-containing protein [Acidimicrobiales bacterium]|nr:GAF domain-containing protein [Acidimicrobiales bacterium]